MNILIWREYQGNKRTPQRFVGREAVVTTQCLNGWLACLFLFCLFLIINDYSLYNQITHPVLNFLCPPDLLINYWPVLDVVYSNTYS